jgi:hypothetical protein
MRGHELDHILLREREITPSARFTASLMKTIRAEAAGPRPIPFPWTRSLPGIVAGCSAILWSVLESIRTPHLPASSIPNIQWLVERLVSFANSGHAAGLHWILLSLALTCACWEWTQHIAGRRA